MVKLQGKLQDVVEITCVVNTDEEASEVKGIVDKVPNQKIVNILRANRLSGKRVLGFWGTKKCPFIQMRVSDKYQCVFAEDNLNLSEAIPEKINKLFKLFNGSKSQETNTQCGD